MENLRVLDNTCPSFHEQLNTQSSFETKDTRNLTIAFRTFNKEDDAEKLPFTRDTVFVIVVPEYPKRGYTQVTWNTKELGLKLSLRGAESIVNFVGSVLNSPFIPQPQPTRARVVVPVNKTFEFRKFLAELLLSSDSWESEDERTVSCSLEPMFV